MRNEGGRRESGEGTSLSQGDLSIIVGSPQAHPQVGLQLSPISQSEFEETRGIGTEGATMVDDGSNVGNYGSDELNTPREGTPTQNFLESLGRDLPTAEEIEARENDFRRQLAREADLEWNGEGLDRRHISQEDVFTNPDNYFAVPDRPHLTAQQNAEELALAVQRNVEELTALAIQQNQGLTASIGFRMSMQLPYANSASSNNPGSNPDVMQTVLAPLPSTPVAHHAHFPTEGQEVTRRFNLSPRERWGVAEGVLAAGERGGRQRRRLGREARRVTRSVVRSAVRHHLPLVIGQFSGFLMFNSAMQQPLFSHEASFLYACAASSIFFASQRTVQSFLCSGDRHNASAANPNRTNVGANRAIAAVNGQGGLQDAHFNIQNMRQRVRRGRASTVPHVLLAILFGATSSVFGSILLVESNLSFSSSRDSVASSQLAPAYAATVSVSSLCSGIAGTLIFSALYFERKRKEKNRLRAQNERAQARRDAVMSVASVVYRGAATRASATTARATTQSEPSLQCPPCSCYSSSTPLEHFFAKVQRSVARMTFDIYEFLFVVCEIKNVLFQLCKIDKGIQLRQEKSMRRGTLC